MSHIPHYPPCTGCDLPNIERFSSVGPRNAASPSHQPLVSVPESTSTRISGVWGSHSTRTSPPCCPSTHLSIPIFISQCFTAGNTSILLASFHVHPSSDNPKSSHNCPTDPHMWHSVLGETLNTFPCLTRAGHRGLVLHSPSLQLLIHSPLLPANSEIISCIKTKSGSWREQLVTPLCATMTPAACAEVRSRVVRCHMSFPHAPATLQPHSRNVTPPLTPFPRSRQPDTISCLSPRWHLSCQYKAHARHCSAEQKYAPFAASVHVLTHT